MTTNNENLIIEKSFNHRAKQLALHTERGKIAIQTFVNDVCSSVISKNTSFGSLSLLLNELPEKAIDKMALKRWITTFTPLVWDKETNKFQRSKSKKWNKDLLEKGMLTPFYSYSKETKKPVRQWNKEKNISSLLKNIEKLIELANNADDEESSRLLSTIASTLK